MSTQTQTRDLTPADELEITRQNLAIALRHPAPHAMPLDVLLDEVRDLKAEHAALTGRR